MPNRPRRWLREWKSGNKFGIIPSMYVAVYRWKLKPEMEKAFAELWEKGTLLFRSEQGALGSRLHQADDGTYFAYAQWPSRELYHAKKTLSPQHQDNLARMRECVLESFPVLLGEVSRDLLVHGK